MKKVLILGANGMAGHVVNSYLRSLGLYDVRSAARLQISSPIDIILDVFNTNELVNHLEFEKFNVVINCIGSLNKDAEDNPDKAIFLNSYLPHFLSRTGSRLGFRLIHISTDCVFSGKMGSYNENDVKDGVGFYAQTKALGEVNIGQHLTIRTSIIGPELKNEGIGLLHWFLNQTFEVNGYTKAYWTGVTTLELAKAIDAAIKQNTNGLYHLVNDEKISKYNLLTLIAKVFNRSIYIKPEPEYTVDKSLINNRTDFNYKVPSYDNMLLDLYAWMLSGNFEYSYKIK